MLYLPQKDAAGLKYFFNHFSSATSHILWQVHEALQELPVALQEALTRWDRARAGLEHYSTRAWIRRGAMISGRILGGQIGEVARFLDSVISPSALRCLLHGRLGCSCHLSPWAAIPAEKVASGQDSQDCGAGLPSHSANDCQFSSSHFGSPPTLGTLCPFKPRKIGKWVAVQSCTVQVPGSRASEPASWRQVDSWWAVRPWDVEISWSLEVSLVVDSKLRDDVAGVSGSLAAARPRVSGHYG